MNSLELGLFDRYVELRELGAGGMARVVLAHDSVLNRRVALKLLRNNDPELVQRMLNEARLTARCQHDNVIAIHEVGEQNGCPYIVLEYLSGDPLSAVLETAWRIPYARTIELVVPVLQALQHIHEVGVVHRDIKPENIFVTASGASKLLDFGIAKLLPRPLREWETASNVRLTRAGMIVGTYEYMSPEQWNCAEVDHLTDLWACGILLHRMICGCHPLHPRAGAQLLVTALLDAPMPSMAATAPRDVPPALVHIVDRCLAKAKEHRWQSANDLLAALSPFLHERGRQVEVVSPSDARTVYEPRPVPPCEVAPRAPQVEPPSALSILFLAADPAGTNKSALDRQAHDIQAELERTGDSSALITQWAPEALDLLRALRKNPAVVHFAGTGEAATDRRWGQALIGDKKNGLFLRGRDGRPQLVAPTALDQTFGAAGKSVKVVVMSSCYSELQAEALLRHVDCVAGMPACHPDAAKAYAIGFYGALGERESVVTAHQQGCAAVALEGHSSEHLQLKVRPGVDAKRLVLGAHASARGK